MAKTRIVIEGDPDVVLGRKEWAEIHSYIERYSRNRKVIVKNFNIDLTLP